MHNLLIINGVDDLLQRDWGDAFVYDREAAEKQGVVVLRWKETNVPIPLNVEISEAALEKGRINWREVHRKVKECLPENILRQRISEANSILRNANRRSLKDVQKDFSAWIEATAEDVEKIFGYEKAQEFTSSSQPPLHITQGTIQAVQWLVENEIDYLANL